MVKGLVTIFTVVAAVLALAPGQALYGRRIAYKAPKTRVAKGKTGLLEGRGLSALTDSLAFAEAAGYMKLSGYDKMLQSDRESLFISNTSPYHIAGVTLSVTYLALDGRTFHRRTVDVACDVPPGETRLAHYRSWDPQHQFYFYKSRPPKVEAEAYRVDIQITGLVFADT